MDRLRRFSDSARVRVCPSGGRPEMIETSAKHSGNAKASGLPRGRTTRRDLRWGAHSLAALNSNHVPPVCVRALLPLVLVPHDARNLRPIETIAKLIDCPRPCLARGPENLLESLTLTLLACLFVCLGASQRGLASLQVRVGMLARGHSQFQFQFQFTRPVVARANRARGRV